MSKRMILGIAVAALLGAACSTPPVATIGYGAGTQFIPNVADNLDDVGLGSAIAVDKDGVPYVSYFGFTEKPKEGAIPVPRPLLNPGVPAVLVVSEKDGIWTRGAGAVAKPAVSGIVWPYTPATVKSLANIKPEDSNGTDIAIGTDGSVHTVWTGPDGVWETDGGAAGTAPTPTVASHVFSVDPPLSVAGPIGRPSIILDSAGQPWVAFASTTSGRGELDVATPGSKGWDVRAVATYKLCAGCAQPGNAQIFETSAGLAVAYVDQTGVVVARQPSSGSTDAPWTSEKVAGNVSGMGLDATVAADGTAYLSYYTGHGTFEIATDSEGSWSTTKVADVGDPDPALSGNTAATSGIAVDENGAITTAWFDPNTHSVKVASGASVKELAPIETPGTEGGSGPALGVSPDGSTTYLSWYDGRTSSLIVGILGSADGIQIAEPSPTPTSVVAAPSLPDCTPDGTTLKITAENTAFDVSCLAAPADTPFKIVFDNKDAGVPHNVSIYDGTTSLFAKTAEAGPGVVTYDVGALAAGTYKFQCDVHPTMFGTFIVSAK